MKLSILPLLVIIVFAFCIFVTFRAKKKLAIYEREARSMYDLLFAFGLWTLASIIMGMEYLHLSLMDRIPLLWQTFVPIILLAIGLSLGNLQSALRGIAYKTPWHWLVFFQALRIGAIGGVMKGVRGEVTSSFVFWVGGPDFLFGLSALVVGWLVLRKAVGKRFLLVWNLVGAAIILVPTFVFMPYWMNEPGFSFIFELPMVLAPSIVVPILVLFNLLQAWHMFELTKRGR